MQIHSYCTIRNGIPDFVDSLYKTFLFGIACRKEEMVYSVTFEEGTEKDYDMVGYENNDAVDYIFPTPLHLSACFSYGINRHIEKHGGGANRIPENPADQRMLPRRNACGTQGGLG